MAETYPCEKCGKPRTKAEGGTTFTVCDDCWILASKRRSALSDKRDAEIEALKAERDEWRDKAGLQQIASEAHKARADRHERMHANLIGACRALNKGITRLRKGRENAIKRAKMLEADQVGANLTAAEGQLAERDEQIARLTDALEYWQERQQEAWAEVARLEAERDELRKRNDSSFASTDMCRDGHQRVLYMAPEGEACPMCVSRAEVARLEGLIAADECARIRESCGGYCKPEAAALHAEARAIKARQAGT